MEVPKRLFHRSMLDELFDNIGSQGMQEIEPEVDAAGVIDKVCVDMHGGKIVEGVTLSTQQSMQRRFVEQRVDATLLLVQEQLVGWVTVVPSERLSVAVLSSRCFSNACTSSRSRNRHKVVDESVVGCAVVGEYVEIY